MINCHNDAVQESTKKISYQIFFAIGIITGVIFAILKFFNVKLSLPYYWVGFYSAMLLLAIDIYRDKFQLITITIISSLLASIPFVWPNSTLTNTQTVLAIISAYALNSYHIAYQKDRWLFKYETLFYGVWDTLVKLFIALVFTFLAWGILMLWSNLFKLIGITIFSTLFSKSTFIYGITPLFLAIGLAIAAVNNKIIRNLRFILMYAFKILLPLLSIIAVLFLLSWLVVMILLGHELKLNFNIFVWVSFLGIIFLNGVYQLGLDDAHYPQALRRIVNAFIVILPVYAGLALYTLIFKMTINPYYPVSGYRDVYTIITNGLNAWNFNTFIYVILLLVYTLCYSIVALQRKKPWLKNLKKVNIILGFIVIAVVLVTNNYWFKHAPFNPGKVIPNIYASKKQTKKQIENQFEALQQRLKKKANFNWQSNKTKQLPANTIILGYRLAKPIYLCRSKIHEEYYYGTVKKQKCVTSEQNKVSQHTNYEVFTGRQNDIVWRPYATGFYRITKFIPVLAGLTDNKPNYICRTIYANRIYVGKLIKHQCHIVVANKAVITEEVYKQILVVKTY